jgi:hypothetical protein
VYELHKLGRDPPSTHPLARCLTDDQFLKVEQARRRQRAIWECIRLELNKDLLPPSGVEKVLKQRAKNARSLIEPLDRANWERLRRLGALDDPKKKFDPPGEWVWISKGCQKEV